jgi:hypothetical protein
MIFGPDVIAFQKVSADLNPAGQVCLFDTAATHVL